jgi:hypothetical protein
MMRTELRWRVDRDVHIFNLVSSRISYGPFWDATGTTNFPPQKTSPVFTSHPALLQARMTLSTATTTLEICIRIY